MSVFGKQENMFLLNLSTPPSTNRFQPHPITHPKFVDKPLRKHSDIAGKKWFRVEVRSFFHTHHFFTTAREACDDGISGYRT